MTNEPASGERPGEDVCTDADFTHKQVASGSAWTVASFAVTSVVRLASSLVLTRILPDAASVYGVMSIVFAFYGGLLLFSDVGIPMLLTQNPRGMEPAFRHTAFTASILRGVLIWLVALALAPLCAAAYPDYEGLQELLSVTALSAVIGGFSSTSLSAFRRRLQVEKVAKVELVSQLTGAGVTMTHALLSPSAWAMVSGAIASVVIKVVLSHWWNDCPDRVRWDPEAARHLKTVGRWVFVSTALTFCADQSERLVLGQVATKEQLGVCAVAVTYLLMTAHLVRTICVNVLYPVLCQSDRKAGDFVASFVGHRRQVSILGGFAMTCLCGGGAALIDLLYADEFSSGGWMLQVSSCGTWFSVVLGAPRIQVCLAKGKPK